MARQKKDFDLTDENTFHQFTSLCELQCTREEVCGFFRVGKTLLLERIRDAFGEGETWQTLFDQYSVGGKISLRRNQFNLSKTNAGMAIFLGKNYLDQVDVKTHDDLNKPITINWTDVNVKGSGSTISVTPKQKELSGESPQ